MAGYFTTAEGMASGLSRLSLLAAGVLLAGCSSLLPSTKEETITSWHRFEEIKTAYDRIATGNTKADLKELGFDIDDSPNLKILSYLDVAAMIQAIPITELDPGLQECLRARDECRAYVIEQQRLRTKRIGNFWGDIFNFYRETDISGWHFKALLVLINDRVTYKLWSGTPSLETHREERNPLGPLQSGDKVINLL